MNTLILNGLQDQSGYNIVYHLTKSLNASYKLVNLYSSDMSADDKTIDEYIRNCNAVIIISPIFFGTLSGKIIDLAAKYIGSTEQICPKFGAAVIVDNNSDDKDRDNAGIIVKRIMSCFNVAESAVFFC